MIFHKLKFVTLFLFSLHCLCVYATHMHNKVHALAWHLGGQYPKNIPQKSVSIGIGISIKFIL